MWNRYFSASSISAQAYSDQWQRKETSIGTTQSSTLRGAIKIPSGKLDIVIYQTNLVSR